MSKFCFLHETGAFPGVGALHPAPDTRVRWHDTWSEHSEVYALGEFLRHHVPVLFNILLFKFHSFLFLDSPPPISACFSLFFIYLRRIMKQWLSKLVLAAEPFCQIEMYCWPLSPRGMEDLLLELGWEGDPASSCHIAPFPLWPSLGHLDWNKARKPPIQNFNAAFPKTHMVSHEKGVLWSNKFEKHWINHSEFHLFGISLWL